jgi:hypothetical protein
MKNGRMVRNQERKERVTEEERKGEEEKTKCER